MPEISSVKSVSPSFTLQLGIEVPVVMMVVAKKANLNDGLDSLNPVEQILSFLVWMVKAG